ncbi:MAG: GAF domain-containing protein [Chloroflexi bacterium]|nr:GAF domain-containing protein [Chloroflexota bacterium]
MTTHDHEMETPSEEVQGMKDEPTAEVRREPDQRRDSMPVPEVVQVLEPKASTEPTPTASSGEAVKKRGRKNSRLGKRNKRPGLFTRLLAAPRTSIGARLNLSFITISVVPLILTAVFMGILAFVQSRNALLAKTFDELEAVETLKVDQLTSWISDRKGDLVFASNLVVVKGTTGVNEGLPTLASLKDTPTDPGYVEAFARAEGVLGSFSDEIAGGVYEDIMMIDLGGEVVFALNPEDVGTDESANIVFQNALEETYIGDIAFNEQHGENDLRMATPVTDSIGETVGVLLFEIDIHKFFADLLQERTGLGETGETYIVGQDNLFRSESRFSADLGVETTLLNPDLPVDTVASNSALEGGHGTEIIDDYRGLPVLSSWGPVEVQEPTDLDIDGVTWAFMAEIDEPEILEPVNALATTFAFVAVALTIAIGVIATLISTRLSTGFTQPVVILTDASAKAAAGDLTVRAEVISQDEIGTLAEGFNQMTAQLEETLTGLEATVQERTQDLEERAREMEASQRVTFAAGERTSPEDFLNLLVNLIQDQFDVYHAQVYMLDDAKENAVLAESTGYAGRQLLQRGHSLPLDGASLVSTSINEGRSVLVADVTQDPNFLPNPLLPLTKSELVVPLKLEDEIIGSLDIQDRVANRFTDQSIPVFETMSEQVAFLFSNNELLEQVAHQTEALEKFAEQLRSAASVATQLGAILNPEQLLNEAVVIMQSRFGLYHVHIYLMNEEETDLMVEAGSGQVGVVLKERQHSISLDNETSVVAKAARDLTPVIVEDSETFVGYVANPLLPDTRSELSVPLVAAGKVLGVLDIQDENPNRFSQEDADTFSTLGGQIATTLQTARVFAEQIATQEELKEREAQFRTLVDYAPEAIVVLDVDAGLFVEINDNAVEMFGYSKEQFEKLSFPDISTQNQPDGKPSIDAIWNYVQTTTAGGAPIFDWLHRKANGETFTAEIRLVRLPAAGRNLVRGSITDITERKAAEETIIQGDRLKSEFLANMSHELRTPLNSIIGYTDVLLMGIDGELDEEKLIDVQAIQENGNHLLSIINDILDLAKIEAGRMSLELSKIDIKKLLEDVVKNNAGLLVNKSVEMVIDAQDDIPEILADHMRLSQVMNNLVSNAAKFTDEGTITLGAFRDNGYVRLEVADTGHGIYEQDLEGIFEEFTQADSSSTRTAEGTGLGLTITRRLVQMHGGTISATSEREKGSTFTVTLPVQAKVPKNIVVSEKKEDSFIGSIPRRKGSGGLIKKVTDTLKAKVKGANGKEKDVPAKVEAKSSKSQSKK